MLSASGWRGDHHLRVRRDLERGGGRTRGHRNKAGGIMGDAWGVQRREWTGSLGRRSHSLLVEHSLYYIASPLK